MHGSQLPYRRGVFVVLRVGEVLAEAVNRPAQMTNGGPYLRGLLEEGKRKSLEPMVARLGEAHSVAENSPEAQKCLLG